MSLCFRLQQAIHQLPLPREINHIIKDFCFLRIKEKTKLQKKQLSEEIIKKSSFTQKQPWDASYSPPRRHISIKEVCLRMTPGQIKRSWHICLTCGSFKNLEKTFNFNIVGLTKAFPRNIQCHCIMVGQSYPSSYGISRHIYPTTDSGWKFQHRTVENPL